MTEVYVLNPGTAIGVEIPGIIPMKRYPDPASALVGERQRFDLDVRDAVVLSPYFFLGEDFFVKPTAGQILSLRALWGMSEDQLLIEAPNPRFGPPTWRIRPKQNIVTAVAVESCPVPDGSKPGKKPGKWTIDDCVYYYREHVIGEEIIDSVQLSWCADLADAMEEWVGPTPSALVRVGHLFQRRFRREPTSREMKDLRDHWGSMEFHHLLAERDGSGEWIVRPKPDIPVVASIKVLPTT
ncbi:MAG: hypothetical protein ACFB6R_01995 [Alphaproteobacteria bacterium]